MTVDRDRRQFLKIQAIMEELIPANTIRHIIITECDEDYDGDTRSHTRHMEVNAAELVQSAYDAHSRFGTEVPETFGELLELAWIGYGGDCEGVHVLMMDAAEYRSFRELKLKRRQRRSK